MRLSFLFFLPCLVVPASALDRPRGVSLEKASFYKNEVEFKCLTDGKVIPVEHVNDDFCDCSDGSDEPGTSACENGLFHCNNRGYKGVYVLSSRVNDGICDCCDGSDEYEGLISCEDTCKTLYEAERVQQEAYRRNQEEGYKVKQEYMQQGKRQKDEKLSRLSELEQEKETLISTRDALEAVKEEAEVPEKEAIDEHKQKWEETKAQTQRIKDAETAARAFASLDVNQDDIVDYPELMKRIEFDIDSDGTVTEEEAKEYLEENEQVDLIVFTEKIWSNIKEIYKFESQEEPEEPEAPEAPTGETATKTEGAIPAINPKDDGGRDLPPGENRKRKEAPKYVDDDGNGEEDIGEDDDDDIDDELGDEDEEEDGKHRDSDYDIDDDVKSVDGDATDDLDKMPDYDENTKRLITVADEARRNYDEANRKVQDAEREISDIKKYLELDFGPDEEYAALKGQCFEYTDREYTYRVCPFDKTAQKPKAGGMETSLGNWGHWHGPASDKFDTMMFDNGQGCWNGPARSTHVNLHCGIENALTSASEPSRCEYQFEFTTPARCSAPQLAGSEHMHEEL